jgi:PAS domain S-box-containing protein
MARTRRLDPTGPESGLTGVPIRHASDATPAGDTYERRIRDFVEHMPGIVYIEVDGSPTPTAYVSPRIEEILGYSPEPFMRDHSFWGQLVHPDDVESAANADELSDRTHEPYIAEYRLRDAQGRWHWFHDEAVYEAGRDGEPDYWQGLMVEITQRKQVEEELHATAAKFQALVEQIPAITYIDPLEPEPVPSLYVSPQIEELVGITPEQAVVDRNWWVRAIHPDDRDGAVRASNDADESGEPFVCEYRMLGPNGKVVWVRDHSTLVRDADGAPLFWQGVIYDISERKQAESELVRALELEQEAVRRLEEADEMKNTFLAAVSHDLRSPLAAILGTALTLEREEGIELAPAERREMLRGLAAKARHLTNLVTDVLDLDRLTHGPVELRCEEVDIGGLVAGLVSDLDVLAGRDVIVGGMRVFARVDRSMIERIVENLLMNAVKHAPAVATIWASTESDGDGVLIAIEDDGPGVPPELRESLFRPFERGPSANPAAPGMGVGLSLVTRFAQQHGGRAWVQDRIGGGASFRVWLPRGLS